PTPRPAPNIMAIHENRENSGFSSSFPSLILPYLPKATYSITIKPTAIARLSNHPMFSIAQLNATPATADTDAGLRIPQRTKPTISVAVIAKMVLSTPNFLSRSSTPTPDSNPGCTSPGYKPTASVFRPDRKSPTIEGSWADR